MLSKNNCNNLGFKDILAVVTLSFVTELPITTLAYASAPFLVYYSVALGTTR